MRVPEVLREVRSFPAGEIVGVEPRDWIKCRAEMLTLDMFGIPGAEVAVDHISEFTWQFHHDMMRELVALCFRQLLNCILGSSVVFCKILFQKLEFMLECSDSTFAILFC